jgi:hypothetical protein
MEHAGYLRRKSDGTIIPMSRKIFLDEIERNNQFLIKTGKSHLIEFEILPKDEIIEAEKSDELIEYKINKRGKK